MHTISNTVTRKFINSIDLSNLEIETDNGWQPISAIHKTVPYNVWYIETINGLVLECADDHIVFDENFNEIFVKNIKKNITKILTKNGAELVISVEKKNRQENMYDVTVDHPTHRFYTNDIISHNTTIANALSYALYGQALTNIKRDNLINKTNGKNMLVCLDFEISGEHYRIERGRKPNVLKFYVNNQEQESKDDNSQGDSRETQRDIEKLVNLTHDMFKHIVALNTYTEPFLSLKAQDQRTLIEQLLGITLLSEKAEGLKEQNRITKEAITTEEFRIKSVIDSNDRIREQIKNLEKRQTLWQRKRQEDIQALQTAYDNLAQLDIEQELQNHKELAIHKQKSEAIVNLSSRVKIAKKEYDREIVTYNTLCKDVESLINHVCPSCNQKFHSKKQKETLELKIKQRDESNVLVEKLLETYNNLINELKQLDTLGEKPTTFYELESDAFEHRSSMANLLTKISDKQEEADPYYEQIQEMKTTALLEISYDTINELTKIREHQEFLLKLLTNKDSFIRKKIIDQNLNYLNARLQTYLERIGLPHTVKFQNDLTVNIEELGRELDFDNLSRGERNRLILSLSWAFRDVWESLYTPINLLFIDEVVDSGMDSSGVENSLAILKKMSRETHKSVWLVSHKDELAGRVNNILTVIKENGFTSYATDTQIN